MIPNWKNKKYEINETIKTYSFKEYFYNEILSESPNVTGNWRNTTWEIISQDDDLNDKYFSQNILPNYKYYGKLKLNKNEYLNVYQDITDDVSFYFIKSDNDKNLIVAVYEFTKLDGMIENRFIWRHPKYGNGLMSYILMDYMLPNYKCIISDANISEQAMNFWMGIVSDAIGYDEYVPFVYNFKNREKDYNVNLDVDNLWANANIRLGVEIKNEK
jgi:hypothetical protein